MRDSASSYRLVPLTQGFAAIVSDRDYAAISEFRWHARICDGRPYAYNAGMGYMHRLILSSASMVDHANGNTLDNRRCNLRECTRRGNMANSTKRYGTTSTFKGVTKRKNRWVASIRMEGMQRNLGSYISEEEAARAYDRAAIEAFGEFARLNFG